MEQLILEFSTDADFKTDTYGVYDTNGPVAYGKLFRILCVPHLHTQFDVEKVACIRAIWIAKLIKSYLNVENLTLTLKIGLKVVTWQEEADNANYLREYATRNGINLRVYWIEGETNPVDKYTKLTEVNKQKDNAKWSFLDSYDKNFDVEKYCQENKLTNQ